MPENSGRSPGLEPGLGVGVSLIAAAWSVFQLWIASPLPFSFNFGIIGGVPARGIHLAFALLLVFLVYPLRRRQARQRIAVYDVALAIVAAASALYLWQGWAGLIDRQGILLSHQIGNFTFPTEAVIGGAGI